MGRKKLTFEFVKEQIEKEGYKLLSNEYKNSISKLLIQCDKGHDEYSVTYGNFWQGKRCPTCSGLKKLTFEFVKEQIEKEGYKLLSNEYINAKTKLKIQCHEGHKYETVWNSFQSGFRCSECAGNKKHTIKYIKDLFEKNNTILRSKIYKNIHENIEVTCPEGHDYKVSCAKFQQGQRCPICSGKQKLTIEFVREQIEKEGYKLLSNIYVNNATKLKVVCPENHIYKVSCANFQKGSRCPVCRNKKTSSKVETKIQKYVRTLTNNVICNDRTQILNPNTGWNLELDIWLPDLNKAIEYNGKYWHDNPKVKIRDKIKQEQCDKLGIDLLIINEQDYINNKEVEMEKIKQFIKEGI